VISPVFSYLAFPSLCIKLFWTPPKVTPCSWCLCFVPFTSLQAHFLIRIRPIGVPSQGKLLSPQSHTKLFESMTTVFLIACQIFWWDLFSLAQQWSYWPFSK
jgi:hypothetical protein